MVFENYIKKPFKCYFSPFPKKACMLGLRKYRSSNGVRVRLGVKKDRHDNDRFIVEFAWADGQKRRYEITFMPCNSGTVIVLYKYIFDKADKNKTITKIITNRLDAIEIEILGGRLLT